MPTLTSQTKNCSKCQEYKTFDCFYSDKCKKDGLSSYCKPCRIANSKQRVENNKELVKEYRIKYYKNNKDKVDSRNKANFQKNKEQYYITRKIYIENNKEKLNNWYKKWKKDRRNNDILFHLSELLRCRTKGFLRSKNWRKTKHLHEYLGCTKVELKNHLESQFQPGMSWDNQNKWHIDHIIPLSSAKTEEELYKLCHYTNLQPLWALDNIKKGSKI